MSLKTRLIRSVFNASNRPSVQKLMHPNYHVLLDFPARLSPRYGYGNPPHRELAALVAKNRANYRDRIEQAAKLKKLFSKIAENGSRDGSEPTFFNTWFTGLDAIALAAILIEFKPGLLLEVGSGNSTKFARAAIRAYDLPTRLVSCDPAPRADIASLTDEVYRQSVETLDPSCFEQLQPGDVLFIDGSHRVFQNSDVTTLFLEVLPRLKRGLIVHIHDVFIPFDYPPQWATRYYSEQYLLAAMMLANPSKFEVLWHSAFIDSDPELKADSEALWRMPGMGRVRDHVERHMQGLQGSIWLQVAQSPACVKVTEGTSATHEQA